MSYRIKLTSNSDKIAKDFDDFRDSMNKAVESGLDKTLSKTVKELRSRLINIITQQVRVSEDVQTQEGKKNIPASINMPKAKSEIIKHIFGEDITKSQFFRNLNKDKTVDDNSNIFVMKKGLVKVWQKVSDSSTFSSEYNKFRKRLRKGLIIDEKTGRTYKLNPNDVEGLKLECSRDTGQTVDSEKKFEAYKNSKKISRRGRTPEQRVAVWTVKKEDLKKAVNKALAVDGIIDKIMEGDYDTAANFLRSMNKDGQFNESINKIEELKDNKNLPESTESYTNLISLARNLSISKRSSKNKIIYTLYSSYNPEAGESKRFFDRLRIEIGMWIVENEDKWFKAIFNEIKKALTEYDPKATFE